MATETTNYKFQKPDLDEFYDIEVQNKNWDTADAALKKMDSDKANKNGGDISKTTVTITEPSEASDKYPGKSASGTVGAVIGKLWRWVESLKTDKAESNHNHDSVYVKKSGGDIAATKVVSVTESTSSFPVPAAGDTVKVIIGKIIKFFSDIQNTATGACFIGQIVNNCVSSDTNKPLSAAQGKALMDLYNGLNTKMSKAETEITNKDYLRITDSDSGDITSHWISFGYYTDAEGKVHINVYIDGNLFGAIPPA